MSGADINATDELGRNALMLAADDNNNNRVETLEFLIDSRIDVNAEDIDDTTVLGYYYEDADDGPTMYSHEREVLVSAGAQLNGRERRNEMLRIIEIMIKR